MDDAQRAAHAMQMEAIARKTLAEAKQEEQKCIRTRLQIGWMYLWRFAIVFVVGGIAGFALSRLT
ncbi:hypothetical protein HOD24_02625 [Candidatus Peregrinibacteria bacterium]|nr:hypothetical protein [Candidatus Peregrinibacteria bacterium]